MRRVSSRRCCSAMKKVEHDPARVVTNWELHQLACSWKLHKTPGYTMDDERYLLRLLYKHAKKQERGRGAPASTSPSKLRFADAAAVVVEDKEGRPLDKTVSFRYAGDHSSTGGKDGGLIYLARSTRTTFEKQRRRPGAMDGTMTPTDMDDTVGHDEVGGYVAPRAAAACAHLRVSGRAALFAQVVTRRMCRAVAVWLGEPPRGALQSLADAEDPLKALHRLRLASTMSLAEAAKSESQRELLVRTTSPQKVYELWSTSSSREITHNCALTLAYLFNLTDMADDRYMQPVLSLCVPDGDPDTMVACVHSLLRRYGCECGVAGSRCVCMCDGCRNGCELQDSPRAPHGAHRKHGQLHPFRCRRYRCVAFSPSLRTHTRARAVLSLSASSHDLSMRAVRVMRRPQ